jgi:hypothetical protein
MHEDVGAALIWINGRASFATIESNAVEAGAG